MTDAVVHMGTLHRISVINKMNGSILCITWDGRECYLSWITDGLRQSHKKLNMQFSHSKDSTDIWGEMTMLFSPVGRYIWLFGYKMFNESETPSLIQNVKVW